MRFEYLKKLSLLDDGFEYAGTNYEYNEIQHGRSHGFSIGGKDSEGLTVHCSRLGSTSAKNFLVEQCRKQKDSHKAKRWFGLAIRSNGSILWARDLSGA